jgi:hypothetical protein
MQMVQVTLNGKSALVEEVVVAWIDRKTELTNQISGLRVVLKDAEPNTEHHQQVFGRIRVMETELVNLNRRIWAKAQFI